MDGVLPGLVKLRISAVNAVVQDWGLRDCFESLA